MFHQKQLNFFLNMAFNYFPFLFMFHFTNNHANAMLSKYPRPMSLGIRKAITDTLDLDKQMLGLLPRRTI
jgi:hypothetical protein